MGPPRYRFGQERRHPERSVSGKGGNHASPPLVFISCDRCPRRSGVVPERTPDLRDDAGWGRRCCMLAARNGAERLSYQRYILNVSNDDGGDWTNVRLTVRGEYYGPEQPRDRTESYSQSIGVVQPGDTYVSMRDFLNQKGARWNTDTMEAMAIEIDALQQGHACHYEGPMYRVVVDFAPPSAPSR